MKRRFYTLDVFTERRLAGNPLAVVLDSGGLDTDAMLAITREFNLSETVFVSPPADPVNTAAVRIFTPAVEMPFAGHPTIGTAVLLASLEAPDMMSSSGGIVVALEEKIGLVRVEVSAQKGRAARGVFRVPKLSELVPWTPDLPLAARALGLDPLDIGFGAHALSCWSAGVPYVVCPVKGLEAIGRARVADVEAWRAAFGWNGKGSVYLYTKETTRPHHHVHARMFTPLTGVMEDPATGSAAAAFAGAAVAFERPDSGWHQLVIEQGYEMGRPSQIVLDVDVAGGRLTDARIGGAAVIVSQGTIETE